ncbi:MAG: sulfurtransferase TusA family protein [Chloroflexi bacterium]|nr:sulfurtransferase TusA family protein [Chloroflexota bacterium]
MTITKTGKIQTIDSDATLDCTGLFCPMPIVHTAMKIKGMSKGQVLEVISDDPGIRADMPAWCQATSNEFLGITEGADGLRVYVRKSRA